MNALKKQSVNLLKIFNVGFNLTSVASFKDFPEKPKENGMH